MTEETIRRVLAESPHHGPAAIQEIRQLRQSVASLLEKLAWALGEHGMVEKDIAKIPVIKQARKLLGESA